MVKEQFIVGFIKKSGICGICGILKFAAFCICAYSFCDSRPAINTPACFCDSRPASNRPACLRDHIKAVYAPHSALTGAIGLIPPGAPLTLTRGLYGRYFDICIITYTPPLVCVIY